MTVRRLLAITVAILLVSVAIPAPAPVSAVSIGDDAFERTWSRTDHPVSELLVNRTWMWGPAAFTSTMAEYMKDASGQGRVVQYFDKSRMEITTDQATSPDSIWYVTNGLLATELVTGRLQLGFATFEDRLPAPINVAGDQGDPQGPTYATFQSLLKSAPFAENELLVSRIGRNGIPVEDQSLAGLGVQATVFVPETNHRIAAPFWDFMNSAGLIWENQYLTGGLFPNPFYATGYPISEAYWSTVEVAGIPKNVLIQVFERRVLTYTPDNAPGWQVEAGNVGLHYYAWRYGTAPPLEPPPLGGSYENIGPTPLPGNVAGGGQSRLEIVNLAPSSLMLTFDGPVTRMIELGPCPDCPVNPSPPSTCEANAPRTTVDLPPGVYSVLSHRDDGSTPDLGGYWTLVPNGGYLVCFFVVSDPTPPG